MEPEKERARTGDHLVAVYVRRIVSSYPLPKSLKDPTSFSPRTPRRSPLTAARVLATAALFFTLAVLIGPELIRINPPPDRAVSGVALSPPDASSERGTPEAAVPDLRDFAMFDIDVVGPCPPNATGDGMSECAEPGAPSLATILLRAATLDGKSRQFLAVELQGITHPADLDRSRPVAFLGGEDRILFSANDSTGGVIRSLSLSTGSNEVRFRSDYLIQDAVYQAQDDDIIAALVTPDERKDAGIWRLDLDSGGASEISRARPDLDVSRRPDGWTRRLFLAPDSSLLVSLDCTDKECEAQVQDVRTAAVTATVRGIREDSVYGATEADLIGIFRCPAYPCPVSALSLADASIRPLVVPCREAPAALSGGRRGALLAIGMAQVGSCDTTSVLAVDTETAEARIAWQARSPEERQLQIIQRGPGLGYSVPDGWIALGPGGGFAPASGETADAMLVSLTPGGAPPIPILRDEAD